jgi:hypothetical protein
MHGDAAPAAVSPIQVQGHRFLSHRRLPPLECWHQHNASHCCTVNIAKHLGVHPCLPTNNSMDQMLAAVNSAVRKGTGSAPVAAAK